MNMLVGTLLAVVIGSYLIITRLFPRIISWFLVRRYNLLISLGKIGLHPLCVYKFSLLRGSVRLSAEWVSLTSSLFNSKVHRPLSIQLHGVLIEFLDSGGEGSLLSSTSASPAAPAPHQSSSAHRGPGVPDGAGPPSSPLVSPKLITVGQFTGLYLLDARAVWTRQRRPGYHDNDRAGADNCQLLTTTTTMAAERLTLEGTNTIRNELTAVLRADRLTGELKQSQKPTAAQRSPRHQSQPQSPLAQWSGDLEIQAMVVQNEIGQHLSDVSVELTRPYVLVSDQLLPRLLSLRSRSRPHPRPVDSQSAPSVCRRWAGLVPRTAALTFADLVLTLGRHDNQDSSNQLVSQLATFRLEARTDDGLQEGSASLRLEELRVDAGACRLASLANLQLSLRAEDFHSSSPVVEAAVGLHTVQLSYYHSAVAEWLHKLGCVAPPTEIMATPIGVTSYTDDAEHVNWRLQLDAEFWDLDTYLVLPDLQPLNTCLTHGKFGGDRSASELVLETVTSSFGGAEPTTRRHAPGVLLVMGALLARHSTLPSTGGRSNYSCTEDPLSVSVLMDSVQVEASKAAAELLYFMLSSVSLLQRSCFHRQSAPTSPPSGRTARRSRRRLMELTLQATNLNGFCVTETGCTMVRVDSFDAEVAGAGATIVGALNRLALVVNLPVRGAAIVCQKSADVLSPVLRATRLKARRTVSNDVTQPQQMTVSARETLTLNWSPAVHEHVLLCARALTGWADKTTDLLRRAGTTQPDLLLPSKPTAGQNPSEHVETCPRRRLAVKFKGDLSLSAQLAAQHRMSVCLTDLSLVRDAAGLLTMSTSQPRISVDGQPIVSVESLHVEMAATSASLSEKRRAVPDLQLKENRCLLVTIGTIDIVTPFNVDLAEALNEELMSVVRWLKKIHHVRKKQFTEDSPLPPDLCVKIRRLSMEISDSPFEVKLRDNYELLEDEYHEGLKRLRTLDKKLEELRRQHGLLQTRKVESLYSQLRERGADVYLSRSRQMYVVSAMRTRLLLMLLEDVEVTALADPLLHGTSRCVAVMQALDPLSPWPDDELQFSTLWCREVVASCGSWSVSLRDYPQKLLDIRRLLVWGRLIGAEQDAIPRATRQVTVHIDAPFQHATVDRSLTGVKYYYDLSADVDCFVMAYGPCWEPAMSLVQLCMDRVSAPSRDPSPPLPFWDKIRLKLHGRFTLSVLQMTWLLHASLDPYNTTEEMEITYSDLVIDWTEGRLVLKGDLSVYVRTASKYDDCRLLYVPNISISSKMIWTCMGDARDHHSVVPCAPDKLPEYSSNQEHDSFRAFRSQYLNLSLAVETRPKTSSRPREFVTPTILLYGSTVRWFEKLKFILSGVTRPVNKGAVFNNVRPKKSQLSRHYRNVRLALNIHSCQLSYWMSFTRQHGVDMRCGVVSLSSEHRLSLRAINDGLRHRPRAHWSVEYMNCELNDAEIWLQSSLECSPGHLLLSGPVEKSFFMSVARVSYGRAAFVPAVDGSSCDRDSSTHRLVVHSMKAAWTKNNRDAGFALFDSFTSNQQLKKNLSTEALRGINIHDGSSAASTSVKTPMKPQQSRSSGGAAGAGRKPPTDPVTSPGAAPTASSLNSSIGATPSPISRLQTGQAASMLQRLIAEAESNPAPVAFSEDVNQGDMSQQTLRGVSACHGDDVLHNNWLIEMVNCQVLLKGIDTRGYVIITSSKSQVLQRVHRPVWRDCTLVSKTSWVGGLEGMQYYATVSAGGDDPSSESILWLTLDNIEGKAEEDIRDFPDIVGSGQSVGGVVSQTVGGCSDDGDVASIQLQRVVSRCRCEFFYASYGDTSVDPDTVESIPPLPRSPWLLVPVADGGAGGGQQEEPVDALTVIHHDLEVCTNSLQYTMVLDIVNNLLLYVAPHKKQTYDQLQSLRFKMQLSTEEDQRRPIQTLQNRIRSLMSEIRRLERDIYLLQRQRDETGSDRAAVSRIQGEMAVKEGKTAEKKELLVVLGQELAMMIHIYKETQLSKSQKPTTMKEAVPASFIRTNEVCIRHAKWRLTEADGQLGISDLIISNFQYTKLTKSDDSVEHLLELGYLSMVNALPNQVYREVLQPAEIQSSMPVERQRSLRVFFRERPPVGGIRVKEHLEINITPINIGMTYQFFKSILKFCFPERDMEHLEEEVPTPDAPKDKASKKERRKARKESSFYVPIQKDDVEKMKERAENNMLFIYIKVPEVTVRVSYKGEKVKNLEDVHNFLLTVPTLEYHNVTWTWLDLLLAMKNDTKRVLLSQAIKQKLQIGGRGATADDAAPVVDEESKTRMLFGAMAAPGSEKHQRRASHSTKPSRRFIPHRN